MQTKPLPIREEDYDLARERIAQRTERRGDCIVWTGTTGGLATDLRPVLVFKGRRMYAYRAVWTLANGPIPDGMLVCHHCDVALCVNLDHLFLGSPADNARDRVDKGRSHVNDYPIEFQKLALEEWASGRWDNRKQLARHLGISSTALGKWLRRRVPTRPELREFWECLDSRAPRTFRQPRVGGERNPGARLTDVQVAQIIARFEQPRGPGTRSNARSLAAEFGVTPQRVSQLAVRTARPLPGQPVHEHHREPGVCDGQTDLLEEIGA